MSSGSETTAPSQIHHRFTTDLLEIYPLAREHNFQKRREFRVLSDVLSDLDIRTGDVLAMTAVEPGHTPGPQAIVAVSFIRPSPPAVHTPEDACYEQQQRGASARAPRAVLQNRCTV